MPAPADIYQKDVDFTSLALRYPDFAKKLKANRQLDFSDPESVRQLTKALLQRDFDLKIELPEDRLCPPVPNRFNYILFVQRLLDSTQDNYGDKHDPNKRVIGLDIGTGASAIYPLLACRQHPSWLFLATEIDPISRSFAEGNIKLNSLESRIKILDTDTTGNTLIPSTQLERFDRIDVLLTNPPFYTSEVELQALAKHKARPPNSACTGAPVEMTFPGGEVAFVSNLIQESTYSHNKSNIQWFSSMLGKLGSVTLVIEKLREVGCTNYVVTEFIQGQKTRRWCVAWSWLGLRPALDVARGTDAVDKKYLPFPTELEIGLRQPANAVAERINADISNIGGIEWRWRVDLAIGVGRSMDGDVWSRHARRKRNKLTVENDSSMDLDTSKSKEAGTAGDNDEEEPEPKFVFKVRCASSTSDENTCTVTIRWLQGPDSTIFESFHGWLKRKLTA